MRLKGYSELLLACLLAACASPRTPSTAGREATVAPKAAPGSVPPAATSRAAASLPAVDFGPPGAIRAVGYPVPIRTGANDPADRVGFSADGKWFGYCRTDGGLGATHCSFVDASGVSREMSNVEEAKTGKLDGPKLREIEAWLAANRIPAVKERGLETTGPALAGTWKYAQDIELHVMSIAGETTRTASTGDERVVRQPALRVGGAVKGHAAVYPYTLSTKDGVGTLRVFYGVRPNGLALSPDGAEIGVLAGWHGMEYAGDFVMLRGSADAFAARVYNATGLALHQRGDHASAREMFLKATFADSSFALAPYNLACAYAKLGDERARVALELAIARGGPAIAEHARADHDFDGVRSQSWFVALVEPRP
jgi:hypothetical protein